jgi:hypothetical protein
VPPDNKIAREDSDCPSFQKGKGIIIIACQGKVAADSRCKEENICSTISKRLHLRPKRRFHRQTNPGINDPYNRIRHPDTSIFCQIAIGHFPH